MNKLLTLLALLVLLTFIGCSDKGTAGKTKGTDSTHAKEYITKISLQEPDRALAIIDTMEMNKEALSYELNYLRFAIYVNGFSDMKMAEYYGKQVLKDSVELKKDVKCHFTILNTLADIANQNSQYAQSIKYAKEAYDLAKKNNVKEYEVSATEALALSLIKLGDDENGFKLFAEGKDEILKSLDQDVDFRKVNNAYSFVGNYMESLMTAKRYYEAGLLIPDLLNITKKMEAVDDVMDGVVEYRQLHTYGMLMKYYDKTGNTKESEKYLALIQKSQLTGTSFVEALVSEHYLNVGDVKRLAELTASIRENAVENNDTLSEFFVEYVLDYEKYISKAQGNYREAFEKAEVISSVKDSIAKRTNEEDGARLAKIYETQEKERLLAEKDAQLSWHKGIFVVVAVVLALALVFIVMLLMFNRKVNRRNKTIVSTINQMMEKEGELTRLRLSDDAKNVDPDEMRLMQSLEMLKDDMPMDDISTALGFTDAADFAKKFYTHFGIHAEEYRKWSRQLSEQENTGVKEAKQMRDSFISSMSHEIRTPLNQIYGFVQLLTDPNIQLSDDEKRQYNDIIGDQTRYMTRLINKFLEISEYESNDEPLPCEKVSIDELFDEVNSVVPRPADGVELTFCNSNNVAELKTNRTGLSRILQCIVGNAVKFTSSGYIKVECNTNVEGNMIFSVTDTGIGIPMGDEERIFDRFYKVDSFVPGPGLGLSLARVIAGRMGATIVVDRSYKDKGSRFVVTLFN